MSQRPSHPSGRPIRTRQFNARPIWRVPDSESNIPRLRIGKEIVNAIGFVHSFETDELTPTDRLPLNRG